MATPKPTRRRRTIADDAVRPTRTHTVRGHVQCKRCGIEDLVWVRIGRSATEGRPVFKLYHGVNDVTTGAWGPDLGCPHECTGPPLEAVRAEADPVRAAADREVVILACGCGFEVIAHADVIARYGEPICSACQSFMAPRDVPEVPELWAEDAPPACRICHDPVTRLTVEANGVCATCKQEMERDAERDASTIVDDVPWRKALRRGLAKETAGAEWQKALRSSVAQLTEARDEWPGFRDMEPAIRDYLVANPKAVLLEAYLVCAKLRTSADEGAE